MTTLCHRVNIHCVSLKKKKTIFFHSHGKRCCSVAKSCLTLWDPTDCCTPGFSVLHYLPDFAQLLSIESVMLSNRLILSSPSSPADITMLKHFFLKTLPLNLSFLRIQPPFCEKPNLQIILAQAPNRWVKNHFGNESCLSNFSPCLFKSPNVRIILFEAINIMGRDNPCYILSKFLNL